MKSANNSGGQSMFHQSLHFLHLFCAESKSHTMSQWHLQSETRTAGPFRLHCVPTGNVLLLSATPGIPNYWTSESTIPPFPFLRLDLLSRLQLHNIEKPKPPLGPRLTPPSFLKLGMQCLTIDSSSLFLLSWPYVSNFSLSLATKQAYVIPEKDIESLKDALYFCIYLMLFWLYSQLKD